MANIKRPVLLITVLLLLPSLAHAAKIFSNQIQISPYNLVFTKVRINDKEVLALIDSGSFRTIELSSTLARELNLSLAETKKVARRYEGKDLYLKSGRIEKVAIGDYEKRGVDIEVIEGDIESISEKVNTKFEVILGWGFISRFHTALNYKTLSLRFSEEPIGTGKDKLSIGYTVINGVPVTKGSIDNQPVSILFDTGAPMCNLDLSLAKAPTGEKVSRELLIGQQRIPMEWRVKDLSVIKKSLDCVGVIGNNLLKNYEVYFDPTNKVIHLS